MWRKYFLKAHPRDAVKPSLTYYIIVNFPSRKLVSTALADGKIVFVYPQRVQTVEELCPQSSEDSAALGICFCKWSVWHGCSCAVQHPRWGGGGISSTAIHQRKVEKNRLLRKQLHPQPRADSSRAANTVCECEFTYVTICMAVRLAMNASVQRGD